MIILVSTTFLVQNQYYSTQIQAAAAHDNVRAATELVASEIRSVMAAGIRVAGAKTLTVRTPMTMIVACYTGGGGVSVHVDGGVDGLATDEVAGVARRDPTTGVWTYGNAVWSSLTLGGGTPAADCANTGGDTTGVSSEYYRFRYGGIDTPLGGGGVFDGDVLMLFRETTFSFRTSVMDTTTIGLFRQVYGGSPIEFATGMDSTAQFQYRIGTSYSDTVPGFSLPFVDVIRIVAEARKAAPTGGVDDVRFGWSVNVALRNLRAN